MFSSPPVSALAACSPGPAGPAKSSPALLHFRTLPSHPPLWPSPFCFCSSGSSIPASPFPSPSPSPARGCRPFLHLLLHVFFSPLLASTFPFFFPLPTIFLLVPFCIFFLLSTSFSSFFLLLTLSRGRQACGTAQNLRCKSCSFQSLKGPPVSRPLSWAVLPQRTVKQFLG